MSGAMSLRGPLQDIDEYIGDKESPKSISPARHASNAKVLSMDRGKNTLKKSLETDLYSALRSNDPQLEQILSALEEISNGLKSGVPNSRSLDNALQRAASCALRQSLIDREIRSLAVTDDLTGLYNRRGFLASATTQLKVAHRHTENVLLLYCDVDNLKEINDSFGHQAGDEALVRAAAALRETFRDSDILARLGGDEFAALAADASVPNRHAIVPRIEKSLEKWNAEETRYNLSFSIGVARFNPQASVSLGELMARADEDMYVHKRFHREVRLSKSL
jgi:two-component system cell cycle response regulator